MLISKLSDIIADGNGTLDTLAHLRKVFLLVLLTRDRFYGSYFGHLPCLAGLSNSAF
jgi:hypothetical protein